MPGTRRCGGTYRISGFKVGQVLHSGAAPRLRRRGWRVDPGGGWFVGRSGRLVDKALRGIVERGIERGLTRGVNGVGLAVVHLVRRHQADTGMVMVLVVPIEEVAAEASGILNAAEALGELRLVLECLEVAFGERVVVGYIGPAMRAGDAEIGEQQRGGPRLRRGRLLAFIGPPRSACRVS